MKTERTIKSLLVSGVVAVVGITISACSGLGGDHETESITTDVGTITATSVTTTSTTVATTTSTTMATTTTKEIETTKTAELGHEESTFIETEPVTNKYIIPDAEKRYLTRDDLKGWDADTLRLARNEIYARHGYIFEDSSLLEYFKKQSWYNPTVKKADFKESVFNDYEIKNVYFIKDLENELKGDGETSSDDGSKKTSETDMILKSIEGRWTTVGNSGLISKTFKGDTMENSQGGINKITGVERFSNSDGAGYKIYIDNGTIYYLFDNDTDFLECHNISGGYSGADSLVRD